MDFYEKYLAAALRFLSYRPRSEKEVRDNLLKKFSRSPFPEEYKQDAEHAIERVIQFLLAQKFLDDSAFVKSWVRNRTEYKQKSKWLIIKELQEKGIKKEFIEKVLAEEDSPEINEYIQAKTLVEKRINKYIDLPHQQLYQKLGAYLGRRGYRWEIIKRSIDDVLGSRYNSD